jgi:hypothetical protein
MIENAGVTSKSESPVMLHRFFVKSIRSHLAMSNRVQSFVGPKLLTHRCFRGLLGIVGWAFCKIRSGIPNGSDA